MKTRIIYTILIILFFTCGKVMAQESSILYFMKDVPYSKSFNPAFRGDYTLNIGGPFSGININTHTYDIKFSDLLYRGTGAYADSIVSPLGKEENPLIFLNKINTELNIYGSSFISILNIGMLKNDFYFNLELNQRFDFQLDIPKSILEIVLLGNSTAYKDVSGTNMNMLTWKEIGIGINKTFLDNKLTIGIKPKLLFGGANISLYQSELSLTKEQDGSTLITSDIKFNSSFPFEYTLDESEWFDKFSFGSINANPLKFSNNLGVGTDLGASYDYNKFKLALSITDIGVIFWKKNILTAGIKGDFSFNGINSDEFTNYTNADDTTESTYMSYVIKEIGKETTHNISSSSYSSGLNPKIFFSTSYSLKEDLLIGMLINTTFYQNRIKASISASAHKSFKNNINTSISYSYAHNNHNIGIGGSYIYKKAQIYFATDNILGLFKYDKLNGIPYPAYTKNFNLWFGVNFVIKKKEAPEKQEIRGPFELTYNK